MIIILVEERAGVGQDWKGEGSKVERGHLAEVHHDSRKLEEFGHVEGPKVCEVEWQRSDSHVAWELV
jgi:hypothetical protein